VILNDVIMASVNVPLL